MAGVKPYHSQLTAHIYFWFQCPLSDCSTNQPHLFPSIGFCEELPKRKVQQRSCADETINNRVRLSLDWCLVLVWAHRPCHYLSMAKYGAWFPERSIMKRINIGDGERERCTGWGNCPCWRLGANKYNVFLVNMVEMAVLFEGGFAPTVCSPWTFSHHPPAVTTWKERAKGLLTNSDHMT